MIKRIVNRIKQHICLCFDAYTHHRCLLIKFWVKEYEPKRLKKHE